MVEPRTLDDVLEGLDDRVNEVEYPEVDTEESESEAEVAEAEAPAEDTLEEPVTEAEAEVADTPVEDPAEEAEVEDAPVAETVEATELPGEPAEEPSDTPEGPLLSPEMVVARHPDGTALTLGELTRGYLRQTDYTEKTQELAGLRQQMMQFEAAQASVLTRLVKSDQATAFLEEHGEPALSLLLRNPGATMEMLNDPAKFEKFHEQYTALEGDPSLSEALVNRETAVQAQQKLNLVTQASAVGKFGRDFASHIGAVAAEFEGEVEGATVDDVSAHFLAMVGITDAHLEAAQTNPLVLAPAFQQLYALFVQRDPTSGQEVVNRDLIRHRFRLLRDMAQTAVAAKETVATEHNEAVKQELAAAAEREAATGEADAPGPEGEKSLGEQILEEGGGLEEFLERNPRLSLG